MKPALRHSLRVGGIALRTGLRFIGGVVGLLATSAQASEEDDELNTSIRGGVLNYRSGKLDDGTDPHGWYERD